MFSLNPTLHTNNGLVSNEKLKGKTCHFNGNCFTNDGNYDPDRSVGKFIIYLLNIIINLESKRIIQMHLCSDTVKNLAEKNANTPLFCYH